MTGHALWQLISHYGYVIITAVGSVVILIFVYLNKRRQGRHDGERGN